MYQKYVKRILDMFFAALLLIILSPVFCLTCLFVKIFDRGPILYRQKRTGLNGEEFVIYKFRTMNVDTCTKHGILLKHEERITTIGKILRKTSIDELPQLFNILKGDMSFVGPRPWIPEYYEVFNDRQRQRVSVLPGVTGLAQAKGRNGIDILQKIEYDIEYANHISFKRDVKIIIMTLWIVLKREHAEIIQESIKGEIDELKQVNMMEMN